MIKQMLSRGVGRIWGGELIANCFFMTVGNVVVLIASFGVFEQANVAGQDTGTLLDAYNVSWNIPGPTSAQSMPLGNGDIGLNVWVEPGGELVFYISKTDAWGENVRSDDGALLKLGRIRVSLSPNPMASAAGESFSQVLKLRDSEIVIKEGSNTNAIQLRVWVDANHPVIRIEANSGQPVSVKVALEDWRVPARGDTVLSGQTNTIAWYHRNGSYANPHVANLTFGALIKGNVLVARDANTLESSTNVTSQLITIYPLTATTATPDEWLAQLNQQADRIDHLDLEQTRLAHHEWWNQFWQRSWIYARGDHAANEVTEGYVLQRFVTACAGRGAYPIKFNGSIFVVDNPALVENRKKPPQIVDADFRTWGGQYWFQNTRAMYWPRLEAGDFDEMLPLFKMYAGQLASNSVQVAGYYHHPGAYFAETAPFWGGLRYWGPEVKEDWTGHYFTPILELSMMMLDYYEYTGDKQFARDTLVPIATAGLQFFDRHFGRDAQGKILLDPDNAIEMYWKVHDPAPDIAGLKAVLSRMIALPDDLVDDSTREAWRKILEQVPDLPTGIKNDKTVLLPYTGEQTARPRNGENPELYSIYPFRLYGLGQPDLQLAIDTFNERRCRQKGCWVQDPIQAAMLGMAEVAKDYVHYNLTRRDAQLKFPAFWERGNDYAPDEDNGGNGENGLQQMLLQSAGKKILLLPAWPKEWDVDFKLNAPCQTTVQGKYRHGRLIDLVVNPPQRLADVVDMSQSPASAKTGN
jgi:alpha-L-fucosidase 2